jgi:hypothetical protein
VLFSTAFLGDEEICNDQLQLMNDIDCVMQEELSSTQMYAKQKPSSTAVSSARLASTRCTTDPKEEAEEIVGIAESDRSDLSLSLTDEQQVTSVQVGKTEPASAGKLVEKQNEMRLETEKQKKIMALRKQIEQQTQIETQKSFVTICTGNILLLFRRHCCRSIGVKNDEQQQ